MSSKITCLFTLTLVLWLNIFHAPHVTAFFDYNKFHPVPYRPDLQEYCPQVSRRTTIQRAIQTHCLIQHVEFGMNW